MAGIKKTDKDRDDYYQEMIILSYTIYNKINGLFIFIFQFVFLCIVTIYMLYLFIKIFSNSVIGLFDIFLKYIILSISRTVKGPTL